MSLAYIHEFYFKLLFLAFGLLNMVKVKQSHYKPRVAQRVSGSYGSQIS